MFSLAHEARQYDEIRQIVDLVCFKARLLESLVGSAHDEGHPGRQSAAASRSQIECVVCVKSPKEPQMSTVEPSEKVSA